MIAADRGVDVDRRLALGGKQRAKPRLEIRGAHIEGDRHDKLRGRASRTTRRWSARGRDIPAPGGAGRRRRSSASRHSTSSRTTAPSAKASSTMPEGGSVFSNVTASRLSTRDFVAFVEAEMRHLEHPVEPQHRADALGAALFRAGPVVAHAADQEALLARQPASCRRAAGRCPGRGRRSRRGLRGRARSV